MSRTAPLGSPGARLGALLAALLTFAATVAQAQDHADGRAAYLARDWPAAETLWEREAAQGSAEALLGLGNLYDFGLVGAPDPDRAFALYREAARGGIAEAAFNVAVMHDSGIGTAPDRREAAAWYAFATLGGHDRAGYNLGQLFAQGDGVTRDDRMAAYWLEMAADAIPAAREMLDTLGPATAESGTLAAPGILGAAIFEPPTGPELRLAWQVAGGPRDANYRIDLMRAGAEGLVPLVHARTEGSAAAVALPSSEIEVAWRIAQVAGDDYAAGPWWTGSGTALVNPPTGIVRFEYAPDDRRAQGLALRLGGAMARTDAVVSYVPVAAATESGVAYGYARDSGFAADVAAFVPGVAPAVAPAADDGFAPGEIRVRLAFDADG